MFALTHTRTALAVIGAAAAAGLTTTAHAGVIDVGRYLLGDHPSGNANPPAYGLRLDGVDGNKNSTWTFSFDEALSTHEFAVEVLMEISGDLDGGNGRIHIFGTMFGGKDTGSSWDSDTTGFWHVDFTYENVARVGNSLVVDDEDSGSNTGTITALTGSDDFDAGDVVSMIDYPGNHGFSFKLEFGHRGFDGISGFGWLIHDRFERHIDASDWLFTASPVIPLPSALGLGMAGFAVLGFGRRRRRDL